MKSNISLGIAAAAFAVLAGGCQICTVEYGKPEVPADAKASLSHPLYITECPPQLENGDVAKLRERLAATHPGLFTTDENAGIAAAIEKNVERETDGMGLLSLLTLTIIPGADDRIDTTSLSIIVGNETQRGQYVVSNRTISGLTPLTYLAYPFVGWWADEKSLGDIDTSKHIAETEDKVIAACAGAFSAATIDGVFARRPKEMIPPEYADACRKGTLDKSGGQSELAPALPEILKKNGKNGEISPGHRKRLQEIERRRAQFLREQQEKQKNRKR